jgi:hypothetical protein
MVLLLPNVLWQQSLPKYVKCYKQERFHNAELHCEEAATSSSETFGSTYQTIRCQIPQYRNSDMSNLLTSYESDISMCMMTY